MIAPVNLSRREILTGSFRAKAPSYVAVIGDGCLATKGVVCQLCRDACPVAAIHFVPRLGGPFLPEIVAKACTGCGECAAICPASAIGLKHLAEAANE
jgi:ferredoxin-type protein NapF